MSIEGGSKRLLVAGPHWRRNTYDSWAATTSALLMKTLSGRKLYAHYARREGHQHLSDTIRDGPDASRLLLKVHETVTAYPFFIGGIIRNIR